MKWVLLLLPILSMAQEGFYVYPFTGVVLGDNMKAALTTGGGFELHGKTFLTIGAKGSLTVINEAVAGGFVFRGGMQETKEKFGFGMDMQVGYQDFWDIAGPTFGMGVYLFLRKEDTYYRLSPNIFNVWGMSRVRGYFTISIEVLWKL